MTRRLHYLVAVATSLLAISTPPARSQDAGNRPKDTIRTVQLQVDPSPAPERALAYRLETPYLERRPGDGATLYQTAVSLAAQVQSKWPDIDEHKLDEWIDSPVDQLPRQEVLIALKTFDQAVRYLDLAGRSERCTWEYPIREEGLRCATPDWSGYRMLSRVLALKYRLQAADGDIQDAIQTLRIMLAMARDVGNGPLSAQNAVGYGLAGRAIREIEDFLQKPGVPNLYWALTSLPSPLIDMRLSLQAESGAIYIDLPELKRVDQEVLTNDEVIRIWNKAAGVYAPASSGLEQTAVKLAITTSAMKLYPMARQHLLEQGRTIQEVESLPNLYVVLAYQHERACRLRDMMLKWCDVPYWQAASGLKTDEKIWQEDMGRIQSDWDVIAGVFANNMPYFRWTFFAGTCRERDIAMLRCVEAIRLYAAGHKGALPKSLDDIADVPIPLDPLYGRPFSYRIADGKTILESPAPPGENARWGTRYEITIRPSAR
jgi:tetratricopeptide (TPR) repeat protein